MACFYTVASGVRQAVRDSSLIVGRCPKSIPCRGPKTTKPATWRVKLLNLMVGPPGLEPGTKGL